MTLKKYASFYVYCIVFAAALLSFHLSAFAMMHKQCKVKIVLLDLKAADQ